MKPVECTGCIADGVTTWRPLAEGPGKRCATHKRAVAKARKLANHDRYVQKTYGLAPGQYAALYEAQGGLCAICGPKTGRNGSTKRLAVDHDHKAECILRGDHPADKGCPICVRGLACGRCNQNLIVHPIDTLIRTINYLLDPPARRLLALTPEVADGSDIRLS